MILDQDTSTCSIGRAVDVLGQPWVLLILREVALGVRRFSDMQDHLGVSRSVLADRLELLVDNDILSRSDYRAEGQRRRSEYVLTDKGRDLLPVLGALREWGDRYLADADGPAPLARHAGCGAPVHLELVCTGAITSPKTPR